GTEANCCDGTLSRRAEEKEPSPAEKRETKKRGVGPLRRGPAAGAVALLAVAPSDDVNVDVIARRDRRRIGVQMDHIGDGGVRRISTSSSGGQKSTRATTDEPMVPEELEVDFE